MGNEKAARRLLLLECQSDPDDEAAWLWRASLAESVEEAISCLEQVLRVNPRNEIASAWLDRCRGEIPPEEHSCPFCRQSEAKDSYRCPQCGAYFALDVDAIAANEGADECYLRHSIASCTDPGSGLDAYSVHYYLAVLYLNLHNTSEGISHLRAACEFYPGDEALRSQLQRLLNRKLVLIVDDSPTIRTLISRTLGKTGLRTIEASNGLDALRRAEEEKPDLVLLDVGMPMMDGYDVCKALRSRSETRRTPVIMLSGYDGFFDKVKGRLAGASEYISKPVDSHVLLSSIHRYVE
ncbi:MAG: response regulator [Bryobacteraceae bacterium]